MALTGLQIYKLLPMTNCKECGFPTCLAFAMKLSQKGTELDKCPYVSDEAKTALDAASAPPIKLVAIGSGERAFEVGNEVVLFRHEKTFYHEPGLVVRVADNDPALADTTAAVAAYEVERVGIMFTLNGIAVDNVSGDAATFAAAVTTVLGGAAGVPLVLMSSDAAAMEAALTIAGAERPLIHAATAANWQAMAELAKKHSCPLVIRSEAGDLSALAELSDNVRGAGVEDLVLDPGTSEPAATLAAFTQLRRLALKKNFRTLGFPLIAFVGAGSVPEQTAAASAAIAKYAGVIVLDGFDPALVYTLITLRLNIYTDPQKPIQMEPKLYEVGTPTADSPLFITTNFSLTYFTVAGEIEGSGVPVWLLVADADGMSVLTAWAAGKFDAEKIAKTVTTSGIVDRLTHKKLVLPGFVAGLSGEVEEELPGWEIMVGPREAVEVPYYLKNVWKAD
jgi:acetyl-CoA decarbonylase/synthase, CODH/ACS complex subunit gamma